MSEAALLRRSLSLSAHGGRTVSVALTSPARRDAALPLILFSHGANAAPGRYAQLIDGWAAHGFAVAAPMHVDSEAHPARDRYDRAAIRRTRIEDYAVVDAAMAKMPDFGGGVIAAGHSFGALIAQVAGGARLTEAMDIPAVRRPSAIIAVSPPPPLPILGAAGWASIAVPMLTITGDHDILPGFVDDWRQHLAGYEAQPAEQAYALLFDGMDHYFNGAFGRLSGGTVDGTHPSDDHIARLHRHSAEFARACLNGTSPPAAIWLSPSAPGMTAITRRPAAP